MKNKIQQAIKDMSSQVSRDSKHIYIDNETGLGLQGVSTVSSIVPKDWLAAWGSKEAVKELGYSDYEGDTKFAKEILEKIKAIETPEEWIAILKEAKGASFRKSKKALVDGTAGHEFLENYVKSKIDDTPIPETPLGTLERPIQQFMEWEKSEVDYWIASEAFVCNIPHGYAGQLDSIYMSKDGKLALGDFKFASHINEEYYLQTAGYTACFEPYDIQFDKRVIIRLPKTVEIEEWNAKEFKYEMKPNNIEALTVPTQYEGDREAFYAALIVKGWINYSLKIK